MGACTSAPVMNGCRLSAFVPRCQGRSMAVSGSEGEITKTLSAMITLTHHAVFV